MTGSTLFRILEHSSHVFSKRPLFHTSPTSFITYSRFMKDVNMWQRFLKEKKINHGDRVMIVGNNSHEWAAVAYATWSRGGVIVPTYRNQQEEIKKHIVNDTKPKLIFNTCVNPLSNDHYNEYNHETMFVNSPPTLGSDIELNASDLAVILYTSGTSGLPKGVPLTHNNIITNMDSVKKRTQSSAVTEYDRFVSFLPWDHCYGQNCELHRIIREGASSYVVKDVTQIGKNFLEYNPSILCAVPKLFQSIHQKTRKLDFLPPFLMKVLKSRIFGKELRLVSSGGSALDVELMNHFDKMGVTVYQGYGSTECSPMISLNSVDENKPGSVGKVLDCNEVKIINGEIYVSGTNVTNGYLNRPDDESFVNIDNKKWYNTGDMGHIEDDYLYITGRLKENYKLSNGIFVNPNDVERELLRIPGIDQAMVFGNNQDTNSAVIVSGLSTDKVRNLIDYNKDKFRQSEIPRDLFVTNEPFTTENGLLTQKQSMKRHKIMEKYAN